MKKGAEIKDKRGQVAIFIIVAIAIVAVILGIFLFPRIDIAITNVEPSSFLRNCIEPEMRETMEVLSKQGGYLNPTNAVAYQGERIQYLCYTSENYEPCKIQQPTLVNHFESEISRNLGEEADRCTRDLQDSYEKRGFSVSASGERRINVSVIPDNVVVEFLSPMTITKDGENTQNFDKFAVSTKSEIYDLLLTAVSILQSESTLGGSETSLYLQYYPDLKIEKLKRNGDTIYTLSNVITKEEFTFATRSLVFPPGYGLQETLETI